MTDTPQHPIIREAIGYLAERCDGAHERDRQGFSKADAAYGARMALELASGAPLDADAQLVIREILVKYGPRQLHPAGIVIPSYRDLCEHLGIAPNGGITSEQRGRVLTSLKVREAERRGDTAGARKARRDAERAELTLRLETDPHVEVRFQEGAGEFWCIFNELFKRHDWPLFSGLLEAVRAIRGRRFEATPLPAHWTVPASGLADLADRLADYRVVYDAAAEGAIEALRSAPPAEPDPRDAAEVIVELASPGVLSIAWAWGCPHFEEIKTAVKAAGARWEPNARHWTISAAAGDKLSRALAPFATYYAPEIAATLDDERKKAEERERKRREAAEADARRRADEHARVVAALGDLSAPFAYHKPGPFGSSAQTRTLRPYQIEGIRRMVDEAFHKGQKGAIQADDMGLGKTQQAITAALAFARALGLAVIVVAPKSLRVNWTREAAANKLQIEVFSSSRIPEPPKAPFLLIADEAHWFKTYGYFKADGTCKGTQRTARFLRMAEAARFVFPLTGTPMPNGRPAEAFPLLRAIGHEIAENKKAYEERYCGGHWEEVFGGRQTWDITGATHMKEWREATDAAIVRRLKVNVLSELPPKTRVFHPVELSKEALGRYMATRRAKWADYSAKVARGERERATASEAAARAVPGLFSAARTGAAGLACLWADVFAVARRMWDGAFSDEGRALVLLTHARAAAALALVEGACELADQILAEGRQVVIFTESAEAAEEIATRYGVPALTGKMTKPEDRMDLMDRFQAGERTVFVGTTKAGGVGLDLFAASDVIMVDPPWDMASAEQAEDRCNRLGQTSAVTAYWLQSEDLDILSKIHEILLAKGERIELLLAGKRKSLSGLQSQRDFAEAIEADLLADLD
jgi:hypothetical protein